MKRGAIIIDLDGTAVDTPRQKLPSERLVAATVGLQAADWHVCVATGRSFSWAMELIEPLGLQDLCIIAGGTSLIDPVSRQLVWQQEIEREVIQQVLPIMEQSGCSVLFDDYTEAEYWQGRPFALARGLTEAYFLELVFVPPEQARQIDEQLSAIDGICVLVIDSQKPGLCDIHIIHAEATKEHAVAELCERLGIDPAQTIGVGDGYNDLHLFSAVGHKVAMGNAVPDIKAAADEIIDPVTEDGLAAYFERLARKT